MTRLGSDDIPPEIWLEIAAHMQMGDIRRAATLNRTFAALVAEDQKDRRGRLVLNTNVSHYVLENQLLPGDWKVVASDIAKKLQECIKSKYAPHIKHIVFHASPMPSSGPQRSMLDELSISLKGKANMLLLAQRLRSTYKEFKNVESLAFLCDDSANSRGPQCLNYMEPQMLWTTWGPNLRELNIGVKGGLALPFMLPPDGCHIQLPRLEVMRFAYLQNYSSDVQFEGPAINTVAQLYVSAAETLHTLELRFDLYAQHTPPIAETLLPQGVVFSKLHRFAFKPKRHYGWKVNDDVINITRFVRDHSSTLHKLQLGDLPTVFDSLVTDTPPAFVNSNDGGPPPIALSIRAAQRSSILNATVNGGSLHHLRQCIFALSMYEAQTHDLSQLSLLGNLCKLSLTWGGYVSLGSFAKVARDAPRILSLSVRHSARENRLRAGIQGDNLQSDVLEALKQWRLKDLGFYKGYDDFRPTWWYLNHMATLIPSIVSFFGRGHMEPILGKPWEQSWVWRTNKYVDSDRL